MRGEPTGVLDRIDAWARDRAWITDPALAAALAWLVAPGSVGLVRESSLGAAWTAAVVVAIVVLHGAVALRRRAPVPVFALVAAAELVLALAPAVQDGRSGSFSAVLLPSSVAYLVAAYWVSVCADRPWPLVSLVVGAVGAVVATLRLAVSTGIDLTTRTAGAAGTPGDLLYLLVAGLAAVLAAWALGGFRRLRGDQVAALAERARSAEVDRELRDRRAAAQERARIARELHDVVAHSVSVMVRQAEAGRYVSAKDPAAAAAALATIADIGREALTDLRALLGVLRTDGGSSARSPQPTVDDVPELVERVRASGQPVRLRVDGEPRPLGRTAHLAAYRVVQEALTNVVKHAGPDAQTDVLLAWSPDRLRVRVSDSGAPAPVPAAPSAGGGGLPGMTERVNLVGGRLRAGPIATGGFEVEADLPVAGTGPEAGRRG